MNPTPQTDTFYDLGFIEETIQNKLTSEEQ